MLAVQPHPLKPPPTEKPSLHAPYKPRSPLQMSAWPSGDFSLGFLPNHKKPEDPSPFADLGADWGTIAWLGRLHMPKQGWMTLDQLLTYMDALEKGGSLQLALKSAHAINRSLVQPSLGLSVVSNSHNSGTQRKIKRGLKGITTRQRRQVKSSGVMLEQKHGRENLSFLTCTLPALSQEEMALINSSWGIIVKRFLQEVRRDLERCGLPGEILSITEIQEGRLQERGELALHLHLVFAGRTSAWQPWALDSNRARYLWNHQLEMVVGHQFDGAATTRIERPRKSLKKELGKYLSKGSRAISRCIELGFADQLPASWTNITLSLRRAVFRAINRLTGNAITNLWDRRNQLQNLGIMRFREIFIPADLEHGRPKDQVIGIAGYLLVSVSKLPLFDNLEELDNWIFEQIHSDSALTA